MRIPINWLKNYTSVPKDLNLLTSRLTAAGHMLDKIDKTNGQVVIDLELRGNRADCYSILGIARETGALFNTKVKYQPQYSKLKKVSQLPKARLSIKTNYVKRVMMVEISDILIKDSPDWLKEKLKAYGVDTINNIVDLTNFVMIETGGPMHAFDLDKIGNNLEIRLAKKGEKIVTFQDKTLVLNEDDLVWAKGKEILSLAGAIGGKTHSISPSTKNILLEAANYDRANIRRTIHRHNLFTDAGIRHEKELDPNLVETAIYRFLYLIDKYSWGKIKPYVFDYYPKPVKPKRIILPFDYLEKLSGLKLKTQTVKKILTSLDFIITKENSKQIEVLVPTHRTDVTLQEDLIEEIIRIVGYEAIPEQILSLEIPRNVTPSYIVQELNLKNVLTALGANEAISMPFVAEKYSKYNNHLNGKAIKLENPPSPDISHLRMTLFPNLLEFSTKAVNERSKRVFYFEIGKTYFQNNANYNEKRVLGLIYWNNNKENFRQFKGFLETIFLRLNINNISYSSEVNDIGLNNSYDILQGKNIVGYGGQFEKMYFAQIDLDSILDQGHSPKASLWPKYPPQIEDITLIIPPKTNIGAIIETFKSSSNLISKIELKDIYKDAYTFEIWYQHSLKNLTDKEVKKVREDVLSKLINKFGVHQKN